MAQVALPLNRKFSEEHEHENDHSTMDSSAENLLKLLHKSKLTFSALGTNDLNSIQNQNIMRLRVNRVSIVQELDISVILQLLLSNKVLSQSDVDLINKGSSNYDKTRFLLDTLTTKEHRSNWYSKFRLALLTDTVDDATQKRHRMLCHFLDNTIIQKSPVLPRIKTGVRSKNINDELPLPSISGTIPEEKEPSDLDLFKQYKKNSNDKIFGRKDDTIKYRINEIPPELQEVFDSWTSKMKKKCVKTEKNAIKLMNNIELYVHNVKNDVKQEVPLDSYFCLFKPVTKLIENRKFHHVYFKYFAELQNVYLLPLCTLIGVSFTHLVDSVKCGNWCSKVAKKLTKLGFNLFDFLTGLGEYGLAENCASQLVSYMEMGSGIESLFPCYKAQVKLLQARLNNGQIQLADTARHRAIEIAGRINQFSFGKEFLNQSELYSWLSRLLLESGSVQTAQSWATTAINNIDMDNYFVMYHIMVNTLELYLQSFDEVKSEKMAVALVQHAHRFFGEYSPEYVLSLISYLKFSNTFRRDEFGFELSKIAISYTGIVYAFDHPQVADCFSQAALSLATLGSRQQALALEVAFTSVAIGQNVYRPQHPSLAELMLSFAKVNLLVGGDDTYPLSISYCRLALANFTVAYGEHSVRTCDTKVTMARLLQVSKGDLKLANQLFQSAHDSLEASQHAKSHIYLQLLCQYAQFYKTNNQLEHVIRLCKQIIATTETYGNYIRWLDDAYILLIQAHGDRGENQSRDEVSAQRNQWLSTNPRHRSDINWQTLNAQPDKKFFKTFYAWTSRKDKIKSHFAVKKLPPDQKKEVKRMKKLISSLDNTSKIIKSDSSSSSSSDEDDNDFEKKMKEVRKQHKKVEKRNSRVANQMRVEMEQLEGFEDDGAHHIYTEMNAKQLTFDKKPKKQKVGIERKQSVSSDSSAKMEKKVKIKTNVGDIEGGVDKNVIDVKMLKVKKDKKMSSDDSSDHEYEKKVKNKSFSLSLKKKLKKVKVKKEKKKSSSDSSDIESEKIEKFEKEKKLKKVKVKKEKKKSSSDSFEASGSEFVNDKDSIEEVIIPKKNTVEGTQILNTEADHKRWTSDSSVSSSDGE